MDVSTCLASKQTMRSLHGCRDRQLPSGHWVVCYPDIPLLWPVKKRIMSLTHSSKSSLTGSVAHAQRLQLNPCPSLNLPGPKKQTIHFWTSFFILQWSLHLGLPGRDRPGQLPIYCEVLSQHRVKRLDGWKVAVQGEEDENKTLSSTTTETPSRHFLPILSLTSLAHSAKDVFL